MGLILIPKCVTDAAALASTPAAVASLPVGNLQLSERGLVCRIAAAAATIEAELPALQRIGALVLWRHKLSTQATWRVRLYDGANASGTLQFDSGELAAKPAKTLGELDWGVDVLGAGIDGIDFSVCVLPADAVARSLRIDIAEPAGEIEVGRLFAGPLLRLEHGFAWDSELAWEREQRRTRTASGGLFVDRSAPWRRMRLKLEWIANAERTAFANLLRDTGAGAELFVSARDGAGGRLEADYAMVATLATDPAMVRPDPVRWGAELQIEEA